MEVCESKFTSNQSDMDLSHTDAIFIMPSTGRNRIFTMEQCEHIGVRNAKVRTPETVYTSL